MINPYIFLCNDPFIIYYDKVDKLCLSNIEDGEIKDKTILETGIDSDYSICRYKDKIMIIAHNTARDIVISAVTDKETDFKSYIKRDIFSVKKIDFAYSDNNLYVVLVIKHNDKYLLLRCEMNGNTKILSECDFDFLYAYKNVVAYISNKELFFIDIETEKTINKTDYIEKILFSKEYYLIGSNNIKLLGNLFSNKLLNIEINDDIDDFIIDNDKKILQFKSNSGILQSFYENIPIKEHLIIDNNNVIKVKVFTSYGYFDSFMRINHNKIELTHNDYMLYQIKKEGISLEDEILSFAEENKDAFADKIDYSSVVSEPDTAKMKNSSFYPDHNMIQNKKEKIMDELKSVENHNKTAAKNIQNSFDYTNEIFQLLKNIDSNINTIKSLLKDNNKVKIIKRKNNVKNGQ